MMQRLLSRKVLLVVRFFLYIRGFFVLLSLSDLRILVFGLRSRNVISQSQLHFKLT